MRYEDCLTCFMLRETRQDQNILAVVVTAEMLSKRVHHHHVMLCNTCGAWWFDDVVRGGPAGLMPSMRDTVMCPCPDGPRACTPSAIEIPWPEKDCHCDARVINEGGKIEIRLEKDRPLRPGGSARSTARRGGARLGCLGCAWRGWARQS